MDTLSGKTSRPEKEICQRFESIFVSARRIGFGNLEHGPPLELSIALHDLTIDEKQSFLQGYRLALEEYLEMAPGIKAFNLLNYAPVVRRAQERKDKARLLNLRVRLNGALDLYSM